MQTTPPFSLDPTDWQNFRKQSHEMLDDMLDYIENIRERPVWQTIPTEVREIFCDELPKGPTDLADAHRIFMQKILHNFWYSA